MVVVYDRPLTDVELANYDYSMREYEKAASSYGATLEAATRGMASIGTILLPEPDLLLQPGSGAGFLFRNGPKPGSRNRGCVRLSQRMMGTDPDQGQTAFFRSQKSPGAFAIRSVPGAHA